ncbi:MAG: hypothetical protein K9M57_06955 [Phycisphaerae bacterium]|nr:hypothetical protein [Phycisphaerae bacterium]
MNEYLYMTLTPETLVASMLPPVEFGQYLTTGSTKQTHDRAIYFDLKTDFPSDYFDLETMRQKCVSHPNGTPKHSVYLAAYRVLEHVPHDAINSMWLATKDGRELELKPAEGKPEKSGRFHLYQELCPVHPLIASTLGPEEFGNFITDPSRPMHVPKICFAELELGGMADDPDSHAVEDLPYSHMDHLRYCLIHMAQQRGRHTVTVNRVQPLQIPYRCIKNGFYLGAQNHFMYYPYPSKNELDIKHHEWWRSANVQG